MVQEEDINSYNDDDNYDDADAWKMTAVISRW